MYSPRYGRSLAILFVVALLLAPWPVEARPSDAPRADAAVDHLGHFFGWLVALWTDNGCTWDPNGGCRESPDNGCTWDPDGGGCRESLDNGCGWDPDGGGCRESLDNGCTADPDGGGCRDNG